MGKFDDQIEPVLAKLRGGAFHALMCLGTFGEKLETRAEGSAQRVGGGLRRLKERAGERLVYV